MPESFWLDAGIHSGCDMTSDRIAAMRRHFSSTAIPRKAPMIMKNSKARAIAIARTRDEELARLRRLTLLCLGASAAFAALAFAFAG